MSSMSFLHVNVIYEGVCECMNHFELISNVSKTYMSTVNIPFSPFLTGKPVGKVVNT